MGMFDWFFNRDLTLPPTRPAPPIPVIKPPKKDISEPVIKLLKMLEDEGVWSTIPLTELKMHEGDISKTCGLAHVNGLDLIVRHRFCFGSSYTLLDMEWLTYDEKEVLVKTINNLVRKIDEIERNKLHAEQREAYKQKLEGYEL